MTRRESPRLLLVLVAVTVNLASNAEQIACDKGGGLRGQFEPSWRNTQATRTKTVALDSLVQGNPCDVATLRPAAFIWSQPLLTICTNCSLCPAEHAVFYEFLSGLLSSSALVSLVVVIRGRMEKLPISSESARRVFLFYVDEDPLPGSVDDCLIAGDSGGAGTDGDALRSFSKTSVLFVSISFIILMVISLAWLVFYYVQRFRYAHAKDRLQRRLFNAAKKALARIPTRPVRQGDLELDSDCPVCIDPYRAGDIVRLLPCRHIFHKTCVDPWLLEHRTCPMCKSDILKAFGYHVNVGRRPPSDDHRPPPMDSERVSVDVHSVASETAYPFQSTDAHDPFGYTPSSSPQLVQVMHSSNARGFTVIPLTVHSVVAEQRPASVGNLLAGIDEPATTASRNGSDQSRVRLGPVRTRRTQLVDLSHVRSRSLSHNASRQHTPQPVSATFRSTAPMDDDLITRPPPPIRRQRTSDPQVILNHHHRNHPNAFIATASIESL